jgi:hypothetical protein
VSSFRKKRSASPRGILLTGYRGVIATIVTRLLLPLVCTTYSHLVLRYWAVVVYTSSSSSSYLQCVATLTFLYSRKGNHVNQAGTTGTTSGGNKSAKRSGDMVDPSIGQLEREQPPTRAKDTSAILSALMSSINVLSGSRKAPGQGNQRSSGSFKSATTTASVKKSIKTPTSSTSTMPSNQGSSGRLPSTQDQPPPLKVRLKIPANMVKAAASPQETLPPPESTKGGKNQKRAAELQEIDDDINEGAQDDDGARNLVQTFFFALLSYCSIFASPTLGLLPCCGTAYGSDHCTIRTFSHANSRTTGAATPH